MTRVCPQCYMGRLSTQNRLFLLHDGRRVLIAPHTKALVCDQCDFYEFDPGALQQITHLLEAPLSSSRRRWDGEPKQRVVIQPAGEPSHEIQ